MKSFSYYTSTFPSWTLYKEVLQEVSAGDVFTPPVNSRASMRIFSFVDGYMLRISSLKSS